MCVVCMHEGLGHTLTHESAAALRMPRYALACAPGGGREGEPNSPPLYIYIIIIYKTDIPPNRNSLLTPDGTQVDPSKGGH